MPNSITVAAFVAGLVLVIAAFIGKELKIAAVEMPALGRGQRLVVGILGVFLVVFGMTDGQWFERTASLAPGRDHSTDGHLRSSHRGSTDGQPPLQPPRTQPPAASARYPNPTASSSRSRTTAARTASSVRASRARA